MNFSWNFYELMNEVSPFFTIQCVVWMFRNCTILLVYCTVHSLSRNSFLLAIECIKIHFWAKCSHFYLFIYYIILLYESDLIFFKAFVESYKYGSVLSLVGFFFCLYALGLEPHKAYQCSILAVVQLYNLANAADPYSLLMTWCINLIVGFFSKFLILCTATYAEMPKPFVKIVLYKLVFF